jgi:hypothetical protein
MFAFQGTVAAHWAAPEPSGTIEPDTGGTLTNQSAAVKPKKKGSLNGSLIADGGIVCR